MKEKTHGAVYLLWAALAGYLHLYWPAGIIGYQNLITITLAAVALYCGINGMLLLDPDIETA